VVEKPKPQKVIEHKVQPVVVEQKPIVVEIKKPEAAIVEEKAPRVAVADLIKKQQSCSSAIALGDDKSTPTETEKAKTPKRQFTFSGGPKCSVCEKTVYITEQVKADEKIFHKTCLRCTECNKVLSLGTYAAVAGKMYCKPHFKQLFKLKGNYSDGFGEEQHKKKWIDKEAAEAAAKHAQESIGAKAEDD